MQKKAAEFDSSLANNNACEPLHDLRNDLAILTGCCELLGDTATTEAQTKNVRIMRIAIDRMRDRLGRAAAFSASATRTHIA
jgi:signal transduction histidine kinase